MSLRSEWRNTRGVETIKMLMCGRSGSERVKTGVGIYKTRYCYKSLIFCLEYAVTYQLRCDLDVFVYIHRVELKGSVPPSNEFP